MPSIETGSTIKNLNTEGQGKRQRNEIGVQELAIRLCPMEYNKLVAHISLEMHLAPDTVKYSFLMPLFNTGFVYNDQHDIVYLKGSKQGTEQPTSKSINKCKNCGNSTPDGTTFCSQDCVTQYKQKNQKENSANCEPESFMEYAKKHPNKSEKIE
jgi:hypothetical protein